LAISAPFSFAGPLHHHWYSAFLSAIGRHDEAIAEAKRAYDLDPLAIFVPVAIGNNYQNARRFDEAIIWYEKALALSPERQWDRFNLGVSYLQVGSEQRAVQNWRDWYALRGKEALADRLGEAYARDEMRGIWTFWLGLDRSEDPTMKLEAFASAQFGDHDRAFRTIRLAMDRKEIWLVNLQSTALLDPLRADPRFQDLLRRVGLPPD